MVLVDYITSSSTQMAIPDRQHVVNNALEDHRLIA